MLARRGSPRRGSAYNAAMRVGLLALFAGISLIAACRRTTAPRYPTPPASLGGSGSGAVVAEGWGGPPPSWPLPGGPHPLAAQPPPGAEQSIQALGSAIAAQVQNPYERLRVLHDWEILHVQGTGGELPRGQAADPELVFRQRTATSAGYAALLAELGKAAGLEVLVVTGVVRAPYATAATADHVWNVARIGDGWFAVDVAWDGGHTRPGAPSGYRTDFLFPPAELLLNSHFPDDARWQLRERPASFAEFAAQPVLERPFFERGWELTAPLPYRAPAQGQIAVQLRTRVTQRVPGQLMALYQGQTAGFRGAPCQVLPPPANGQTEVVVEAGAALTVTCALPETGEYAVQLSSRLATQSVSTPFFTAYVDNLVAAAPQKKKRPLTPLGLPPGLIPPGIIPPGLLSPG